MRVYFDNVNFSSNSGPNTFGTRLANELHENFGVTIVGPNDDYDVFLCFIEPTHNPKKGSKTIQRLDGIWFKPEQFHTHNRLIKMAYENFDYIVWQSEFDKNMTCHHWGSRPGSVIGNGINLKEKIIPGEKFLNWRKKFEKLFVCSANWHRQKRLKENTEFFLKNSSKNDALIVLGKNPDYIINNKNIFYLGSLPHKNCLEIYSKSDWMIHLAWLDHCPNVVVESLSQNCPVICTDSGGTHELVKKNGIIIKEKNPYNYELTDYDIPYDLDIKKIDLDKNKLYLQSEISNINIKNVAKEYYSLFKK